MLLKGVYKYDEDYSAISSELFLIKRLPMVIRNRWVTTKGKVESILLEKQGTTRQKMIADNPNYNFGKKYHCTTTMYFLPSSTCILL